MRPKHWIAVVLSLAALIFAARIDYRLLRPAGSLQALSACPAQEANTQGDIVFVGCVVDNRGKLVQDAWAMLTLTDTSGQTIWQGSFRPEASSRVFKLRSKELPGLPGVHAGVVAAEAPWHLASKVNVIVTTDPQGNVQISPTSAVLRLDSFNPFLTFVILLPGIFGLMIAVVHLTGWSETITTTYTYAVGMAGIWSATTLVLAFYYFRYGDSLIPLFFPDLFVSSGVVVFAFIGSLVYAAYTVEAKPDFFTTASPEAMRSLLMMLGGRITVAPYIALVAYGVFAATFPTLRNGAFALFFGFFTGLWIDAVIRALDDVGSRFLSEESKKKVAALMTRPTAPELPAPATASASAMKPEQAFLDAVEAARKEFLEKEGVVGISAGFKVSAGAGNTGQRAIVVYVYEKQDLPPGDPNIVPPTFMGVLTDVVPLPPADRNGACRHQAFDLSWKKLQQDNQKRIARNAEAPHAIAVDRVGEVLVLADSLTFFPINSQEQREFDILRAYELIRPRLGDRFDFVAFIVHWESWGETGRRFYVGDYSVPVLNDVSGIKHYKGDAFSDRPSWGTSRLRACQVHSYKPLTFYRCLHEVAHSWCAYATFRDPIQASSPSYDLLMGQDIDQGRYHWGENFDDGRSCVDYDMKEWVPNGNGTFTHRDVQDGEFAYCPLDLYLMGLVAPAEVGPIRILREVRQTEVQNVYFASVREVSIDQVIASCGPRVPAVGRSPKAFTQAFVVLSNDPDSGNEYAKLVDDFRNKYEAQFSIATGGRATISTNLS
ncbi:MAG: hypothetical protein ABSA70_01860 [Terriglobia bacterium]